MTSKDWLAHLASLIASRLPGNRAHLQAYAGAVAKSIPAHWLTPELAERVERHMLDRMKLAELLAVINLEGQLIPAPKGSAANALSAESAWIACFERRVVDGTVTRAYLSLVRQHGPSACWVHIQQHHGDLVQELAPEWVSGAEDDQDKRWWREWLGTVVKARNPTVRWVHATEILHQVSQPDSHPRPWLVDALYGIIDRAKAEGADTTAEVRSPRPYPQRGQQPQRFQQAA
jgi:hypothetical protein